MVKWHRPLRPCGLWNVADRPSTARTETVAGAASAALDQRIAFLPRNAVLIAACGTGGTLGVGDWYHAHTFVALTVAGHVDLRRRGVFRLHNDECGGGQAHVGDRKC